MQKMRDARDARQKYASPFYSPIAHAIKGRLRSVALIFVSICALLVFFNDKRAAAVSDQSNAGMSSDFSSSSLFASAPDYSKFSHSSPGEHKDLMGRNGRENCASCHRPSGALEPSFPKHKDCTGCHLVQFTAASSSTTSNPICTICHNETDLNSGKTQPKKFSRLRSFNAEFDHAQHLNGKESARPSAGCAACHTPASRGVAESIPARLNAHQICYECHSAGKQASDLSSCGVCHALGSYAPTSTNARAYRLSFSHQAHARETCISCHNVKTRGLPQARQVSSVSPVEHLANSSAQNCKTCHNLGSESEKRGQRAFGDTDTHFCKRCHKREGFRMAE
jgi:Cytochrome c7 and related cytochrome c